MSERTVTAVVLLTGQESPTEHLETFTAIQGQTRRPDRVVVVAPTYIPTAIEDRLNTLYDTGEVDHVLRTASTHSFADQVKEVLEYLSITVDDTVVVESPERVGRGRRARAGNAAQEGKRILKEAENLAQVPERLRTAVGADERRTMGRRRASSGDSWLWFLTESSAPGAQALERLLDTVHHAPTTAVAGAKRLRHRGTGPTPENLLTADDAESLVDVGITISHGGRIVNGIDAGEIDQGQSDWRHDVLAVALPGMLVREETLKRVGGFDPAMPTPWAEIDLCHRVWRNAERVAVVADAKVVSPASQEPTAARVAEFRRGQILTLVKHRSMPMAILLLLTLPFLTLFRMVAAVATHRPGHVFAELRGWADAMVHVPAVMGRGVMASNRLPVPRRRLAPLYLPRGEDLRQQADDLWTRLFADDELTRRARRTTWGIAGTTHGADDADYGRHGVWTLIVLAATAILSILSLRSLVGTGDLVAPYLMRIPETVSSRWDAAWQSWVGGGLGSRGPSDPLMTVLSVIPLHGSTILELVLLGALPVSMVGAWWASGALTRSIGLRLALTAAWGMAPSLLGALSGGLWQMALVHALLPLLALALGRAIGLVNKVGQASVAAAGAAGLIALVITAVQPLLFLAVGVVVALLAPAVPGRRRRLAWVLVPSLALLLPRLPSFLAHPRALLGGVPGVPANLDGGLTVLTLWPPQGAPWQGLAPIFGHDGAAYLPVLMYIPFLLAALVSPLLAGAAGRAGRLGLLVAALSMLFAVLTSQVAVGMSGDRLTVAPAHASLSFALMGLLLAAGATCDGLARAHAQRSPLRPFSVVVALVVAVSCATLVVGWGIGLPGSLALERGDAAQVPAAAADASRSSAQSRILVLSQEDTSDVSATLVVDGGTTIAHRSAISEAREIEAMNEGRAADDNPGAVALQATVAELLSGSTTDETAQALAILSVEYVYVPGAGDNQQALIRALDSSVLLQKVTTTTNGSLWRAAMPMPRAWVASSVDPVADSAAVALNSDGIRASGDIDAAAVDRVLVLSDRADSRWHATVGGTQLERITVGDWAQGFIVPAGTEGVVTVERDDLMRVPMQLLLGVAVGVTALVALPWQRRSLKSEEYR